MNQYRTPEETEIINFLRKVVRTLNKIKGTTLKISNVSFGLGVDTDNAPDTLSKVIDITIQNTQNKKTIRLHYYISAFDINIPHQFDDKAGVDRVSDPEDKLLLRFGYSIWFYSKRISSVKK